MVEEDTEFWVGLWVNSGLEYRKENILQHLAKVWHKVPASEDVTEIEEGQNLIICETICHGNHTVYSLGKAEAMMHLQQHTNKEQMVKRTRFLEPESSI